MEYTMTPSLAEKNPQAHARLFAAGFTEIARLMEVTYRNLDIEELTGAPSSSVSHWFHQGRNPLWKYEYAARDKTKNLSPEPSPTPRPVPIAPPSPQIQHEKKMLMVAVNGNESQVRKALDFLNCEVFE
jgi:hypothetical protein